MDYGKNQHIKKFIVYSVVQMLWVSVGLGGVKRAPIKRTLDSLDEVIAKQRRKTVEERKTLTGESKQSDKKEQEEHLMDIVANLTTNRDQTDTLLTSMLEVKGPVVKTDKKENIDKNSRGNFLEMLPIERKSDEATVLPLGDNQRVRWWRKQGFY